MSELPSRETFETLYSRKAPWDIGKPQPTFVAADASISGSVLDAGCGTGENALYFAGRGQAVLGIDFLPGPIAEAQRKADARGVRAEFLAMDALELATFDRTFDSVIDSGLFHVFSDEDRVRYAQGLAHVTRPGGRLFLLCFSDQEPGTQGPRRVTQPELRDVFVSPWHVESITPSSFEVVPDLKDFTFSEGGPKAWFAVVRRQSL